MNSRLKQLIQTCAKHGIDAFLVTNDINIKYLTGFPASESWLLVTKKKAYYITDFRYVLEARAGLKGIPVNQYTESIFKTMYGLVQDHKAKKLGFDDRHLTYATFKKLKVNAPKKVVLQPTNNFVETMRMVKTKAEITQMKKALKLNLEALKYIKRVIKSGVTEKYVLEKLTQFVKSKDAGFSFDPIIASGPNSCYPHAHVTGRKLRKNEPVLVDMGIDLKGYKSDLTRMFFLGKIAPRVKEVNDIVREAQHQAIKEVRAGIPASKVDFQARNYLKKHRLDKYFGHSLGHGVGLEIHEGPSVSAKSEAVLKENMIFTVEPAVYLPGQFGIRIEDMVLVTKKGCEVLSDRFNE